VHTVPYSLKEKVKGNMSLAEALGTAAEDPRTTDLRRAIFGLCMTEVDNGRLTLEDLPGRIATLLRRALGEGLPSVDTAPPTEQFSAFADDVDAVRTSIALAEPGTIVD
jgi:ubiquinone biosynthesis protein UbiJ